MKTGIELIAIERKEQIEKHGRTPERDVAENVKGQLIEATIALLETDGDLFPESWSGAICEKMLMKPYINRLIIAGALIAAEIDRYNNITNQSKGK